QLQFGSGQQEGLTGNFQLTQLGVTQILVQRGDRAYIVLSPSGREFRTVRRELVDQFPEATVRRVANAGRAQLGGELPGERALLARRCPTEGAAVPDGQPHNVALVSGQEPEIGDQRRCRRIPGDDIQPAVDEVGGDRPEPVQQLLSIGGYRGATLLPGGRNLPCQPHQVLELRGGEL